MKKTVLAVVGGALLAGVAFTPVPAHAFVPFPLLYPYFEMVKNPKFKAVNPYAKKAGRKARKARQ
jgi:hypothetical protein